jgi:pectate lyase
MGVLAACMAAWVPAAWAQRDLPTFPGAEGFGATTPGGRGGQVVEVTNLHDSGPGSLRAAIGFPGPRIVVFRVGGTIELATPLQVLHPYLTIAGQTAPGGGITLKNGKNTYAPLQIKTHDVVIRYLRSRPGPGGLPPTGQDGSNVDALTIADPQRDVHHVVVDHCSLSWSVDEVINTWYAAHEITVQWCILSEGLQNPEGRQGAGSKGPLFGGRKSDRISVHHNLLAHNVGRNPMIKATGLVDLVNNVIFVPRTVAAVVDGELGPCHVNLVGNQVIAPHGDGLVHGVQVLGPRPVTLYVEENLGPLRTRPSDPQWLFVSPRNGSRECLVPRRQQAPPVRTHSAAEAFERVLESAGCTLPQRDAVDLRVIADVRQGRTRVISDPAEVGGWPVLEAGTPVVDNDHDGMPDDWERRYLLDPADPGDGPADSDEDGYTNLEEYLNRTAPRTARS